MTNAEKNREEVADIDRRFRADEITKEQAEAELQVIADRINEKSKEIAKKYPMFAKNPRLVRIQVTKSHGAKLY